MTAHRRTRKNKRSKTDDPYTQRYRKASDGAKAARAAAGSREQGNRNHQSVSLDVIEEGATRGKEALRAQGASDTASLGERGTAEVEGQSPEGQGVEAPTFFEQVEGVKNLLAEANGTNAEVAGEHKAFLEKEVDGLPKHVGTELCTCDIRKDHWIELGEN